jgi:hypothetical protein
MSDCIRVRERDVVVKAKAITRKDASAMATAMQMQNSHHTGECRVVPHLNHLKW